MNEHNPRLTWLWVEDGRKSMSIENHFADFDEAMKFVNEVADIARKMDHHPRITIDFNKVNLYLTTHSSKGLTEKDYELAREIERQTTIRPDNEN